MKFKSNKPTQDVFIRVTQISNQGQLVHTNSNFQWGEGERVLSQVSGIEKRRRWNHFTVKALAKHLSIIKL